MPQVDVCAVLSLIAPGLTTMSDHLVLPAPAKSRAELETGEAAKGDSELKSEGSAVEKDKKGDGEVVDAKEEETKDKEDTLSADKQGENTV